MTNKEFIESISLEGEIWKDVIGYEGMYMVSNLGRVLSLSRYLRNGGGYRLQPPTLMTPQLNNNGYLVIILRNSNVIKHFLIHRLVAITFIDNPNNSLEIDHLDGDRLNNICTNLSWCSKKENMNNPITKKKISNLCFKTH